MITLRKLKSLKDVTRLRKYIIILQELETELINGSTINHPYYKSILNEIFSEMLLADTIKNIKNTDINLRNINNIRHTILKYLGIEPSEWDFTAPLDRDKNNFKTGLNLYLEDIRSPFNLGSLFRSAECFGVDNIYLSENSTSPSHPRAKRTSMGCIDIMDWEIKSIYDLDLPIFALELGGTSIQDFTFPDKGICIIGSEELGVSPEALKLAESSLGRVSIPLFGSKSSLNVANATSILLQRWSEKKLKS